MFWGNRAGCDSRRDVGVYGGAGNWVIF